MNTDLSKLDGAQLLDRVDAEMQKMIEAHVEIEMRVPVTDLLAADMATYKMEDEHEH